MEHEELIRFAGEQALLRQELKRLDAEQARDIKALRELPSKIEMHDTDWFEKNERLLLSLHERQQRIVSGYSRFRELMKITGIGLHDM